MWREGVAAEYLHLSAGGAVACGRGSVRLWRRCDALRTSGIAHDVVFSCCGLNGGVSSSISSYYYSTGVYLPQLRRALANAPAAPTGCVILDDGGCQC